MAGGIDWFRWHHGSVTDPKFQLVAKKAGTTLPAVLAVWAYLLEKASAAEFRGCFGEIDCDAVDCLFCFDEGTTDAILLQMIERKLIADEYIVAWDKRQTKRERSSDCSTDRVKAFRERKRHETPCNASNNQETPREEKRREEVNLTPKPEGFVEFWSAYPKKIGKGAAEKAWKKNKPPVQKVLDAIEQQKSSPQWTKDKGQFIPNPATWINQSRWEDSLHIELDSDGENDFMKRMGF